MKVTINVNSCIGCNMCEGLSGGVISAKTGKAVLDTTADLSKSEVAEAVRIAAQSCPMQAISIEE